MAKASAHITLTYMIDIVATYRYYLLQSSTSSKPSVPTTNPPSSSWDDVEPTYTSGSTNSLYYVDLTVFSDDSFSYTPVSLSTAYEAAKEAYNKATNAQNTADDVSTNLTNNYYTKTETDAQIDVSAESITLSVSATYATKTEVAKKADDYTVGLYNSTGGNPKGVKFATVDYSTCTSEAGVSAKIGMVSGHGNGTSYAFLQDAIIRVNYNGTVEVDNTKHYGAETPTYDDAVRQYGDIFWVADTTNSIVDFYCLMGQYSRLYQTPWKRLTYSTGGTVTQHTSCTVYSSGTKVWANNSDIALKTELTEVSTAAANAQADIDNLEIGGRNLLTADSAQNVYTTSSYIHRTLYLHDIDELVPGETYTISFKGELPEDCDNWYLNVVTIDESGNTSYPVLISGGFEMQNGRWVGTGVCPDGASRTHMYLYATPLSATHGEVTTSLVKLEKGNKATDWTPAPEDVEEQINDGDADVQTSVTEQLTQLIQDTEGIIMKTLETYVTESDLGSVKETVSADLEVLSSQIRATITKITEDKTATDGRLEALEGFFQKYFTFDDNGLTIRSTDSSSTLQLDNTAGIVFHRDGVVQSKMWEDNFYTGNIFVEVTKQARFGGLAAKPRSARKLTWMEVGE